MKLKEMINNNEFKESFKSLEILVLDEADRLID